MPKIFYTEREIVDLVNRGITSLEVTDDVVLTDLAREMALKHNLRLVRASAAHPAGLSQTELAQRIKAIVIARMGGQVDTDLLDAVIAKVLRETK